jgi:hypothetical protein
MYFSAKSLSLLFRLRREWAEAQKAMHVLQSSSLWKKFCVLKFIYGCLQYARIFCSEFGCLNSVYIYWTGTSSSLMMPELVHHALKSMMHIFSVHK